MQVMTVHSSITTWRLGAGLTLTLGTTVVRKEWHLAGTELA